MLNTRDEERVPEGVLLGSFVVHDVAQEFVDLGGGELVAVVHDGLGNAVTRVSEARGEGRRT